MTNRKALHAYVSDQAHDQWHEFAAKQGVSVSAMIEALAPAFDRADDEQFASMVTAARKIDAQRRRRSKSAAS